MKRFSLINLLAFFSLILLISCNEEDDLEPISQEGYFQRVNSHFYQTMDFYYLWNDQLPNSNSLNANKDPLDFFEDLRYTEEDIWSWIVDDYQELINSFNGIEASPGYSLAYGKFSNVEEYYGIVKYVYPNSIAEEAGIKRGDVILTIDGSTIRRNDLDLLTSLGSFQLGLGEVVYNEEVGRYEIASISKTVNVISVTSQNSPIVFQKVIEKGDKKIGYLYYDSFIHSYNQKLREAIASFKSDQVNELVLDLRYNLGGHITSAKFLSELIGPSSLNGEVFIKRIYNKELESAYIEDFGEDVVFDYFGTHLRGRSDGELEEYELNLSLESLNLDRVFILTTKSSASSSELVINGLNPYMEVITIGDDTSGKYTGSRTFRFYEDIQTEQLPSEELRSTYGDFAIQPIIMKNANRDGFTNYKNGFAPIYRLTDDFEHDLGDENEAYLAKAIEIITGDQIPTSLRSSTVTSSFDLIPFYPKSKRWMENGFVDNVPHKEIAQ